MKYTTVPFVGGFYADETRAFSVQDCVNYLPEQAESPGTRTPEKLKTPPGLKDLIPTAAPALTGTYANGYVSLAYSSDLTISGGYGIYTNARVTSGALPAGLSLSIVGNLLRLSGTPTGPVETDTFVVAVDSIDGQTATSNQSVMIQALYPWLVTGQTASLSGGSSVFGDPALVWQAAALNGQPDGNLYAFVSAPSVSYVSRINNYGVSYSTNQGVSWAATSTPLAVSSGGGLMEFRGAYQFLCSGVQLLQRRTTGAWSNPSSDTKSRANTIIVVNNKLIVASIYASTVSVSSDDGVTWVSGGNLGVTTTGFPRLATNGNRVVGFYNNGGVTNQSVLKYSDDAGTTWSVVKYTFPNPSSSNLPAGLCWTGTHWIASTTTGQVAYSSDAITWNLSVSTIGSAIQIAGRGGKALAACGTSLYLSNDDGVTWSTTPIPTGLNTASGVAVLG